MNTSSVKLSVEFLLSSLEIRIRVVSAPQLIRLVFLLFYPPSLHNPLPEPAAVMLVPSNTDQQRRELLIQQRQTNTTNPPKIEKK